MPDLDSAIRSRFIALCDQALDTSSAELTPDQTMALLDQVVDQMAREFGEGIRTRCWLAVARAFKILYPDPATLN